MHRTLVTILCITCALLALGGCISSLPQAEFSATPQFDYPPLVVSLNAGGSSSPNGTIVSYEWDFGDGDTAVGALATHTYEEKGLYTVTLTITDSAGKTGSRSKVVEALNRVPFAIFSPSVYSTAVHQPVWFDASESYDPDGEIVEYLWDFGDGERDEGVVVQHEYATAGGSGWRPMITLTVIDDNDGTGSRTEKILVVGCDSCSGN